MRALRSLQAIAAVLCITASAAAQGTAPASWQVVDRTERDGEEPVRVLTTSSIDSYASPDGSLKKVFLQLHCAGALSSSATLSADDTFNVKSDATVTLPIRLDGQPAIHAGWANLSLHQILIYDLRDLLPSHRQATIELPLGSGAPQRLTFDLSQLGAVMARHSCRRRL